MWWCKSYVAMYPREILFGLAVVIWKLGDIRIIHLNLKEKRLKMFSGQRWRNGHRCNLSLNSVRLATKYLITFRFTRIRNWYRRCLSPTDVKNRFKFQLNLQVISISLTISINRFSGFKGTRWIKKTIKCHREKEKQKNCLII